MVKLVEFGSSYTTVDNNVRLKCNVTITHCPAPPAWACTPNLFLHQCVRVASSEEGGVLMISAGVRPVRSCAHRLNRLSLNSLAHPIVHGGWSGGGTSQALLVPPKRDATEVPFWGQSVSLTASRDRHSPGQTHRPFSRRFARTRQTGLSSDMRPRRRAHLGLTRLVCLLPAPCRRRRSGGCWVFIVEFHWPSVSIVSETGYECQPKTGPGWCTRLRAFLPLW